VQKYRERAEAVMVALLNGRNEDSSICPSDVARVIGGEGWRDLMPLVASAEDNFSSQTTKINCRFATIIITGAMFL